MNVDSISLLSLILAGYFQSDLDVKLIIVLIWYYGLGLFVFFRGMSYVLLQMTSVNAIKRLAINIYIFVSRSLNFS